jgi:hypothetical protein
MRKVKSFLERNKIYFEIFSFIIIGLSGVYVSYTQSKISKLEYELNKTQIQPLLKIETKLTKSDTIDFYTTQTLIVSNEGGALKKFNQTTNTFYKVELNCPRCNGPKIYYIPIHAYYFANFYTGNFKDVLLTSYCPNNNYAYCKLYEEFIEKSKNAGPYFLDRITLMKISYDDISGENHTNYYNVDNVIGGYEIPVSKYQEIISKSDSAFKDFQWDFDKLSFDKILEITHN